MSNTYWSGSMHKLLACRYHMGAVIPIQLEFFICTFLVCRSTSWMWPPLLELTLDCPTLTLRPYLEVKKPAHHSCWPICHKPKVWLIFCVGYGPPSESLIAATFYLSMKSLTRWKIYGYRPYEQISSPFKTLLQTSKKLVVIRLYLLLTLWDKSHFSRE